MRRAALLVACCLATTAQAATAPAFSRIASPPGGNISCFVFDQKHPGVTLAGSTGGVIYRSTNGGANWTPIKIAPPNQEFRAIAQSPAASGTFYAFGTGNTPPTSSIGASGLVYSSTDDGVTWTLLPHQPPVLAGFRRGAGRAIAIDSTGQIIVLSDHLGGIYRSTDAGSSWSIVEPGTKVRPYGLTKDPTSTSTLYAAGVYAGGATQKAIFLKSTNFGASWTITEPPALNTGLTNPFGYAVAVQPGTGEIIVSYGGTNASTGAPVGGIARSTDGGATFAAANKGIAATFNPGSASAGIAFDTTTPTTVYLSTNGNAQFADGGGFYISTNSGESWVASGAPIPQNGGFVVATRPAAAGYPAAVFVGEPDVAISTNSGKSWAASISGIGSQSLFTVVDSGVAGGYYAGTYTGVFHTGSSGKGWTATAVLPGSHFVNALAIDLTRAKPAIYAVTNSGLFRSTNNGASWVTITPKLGAGLQIATVETDSTGTVFATDTGHTVYRSANEGATWASSTVGGSTDVFAGVTAISLANIPAGTAGAGTIYANLASGLWVSTNDGVSWTLSAAQVPASENGIYGMAVQQAAPHTLVVNTNNDDTYTLTPGASAFAQVTGPTGYFLPGLAAAPGSASMFNASQTSVVAGSSTAFATSVNVASSLTSVDSYEPGFVSATKSTLFVSDFDGSTFVAPYTSLPQ
jgi:hypothetical protein